MRSKKGIGFLIIIVAVVVVGFILLRHLRNQESQPVIKTARVERGTVTTVVSATGTLQPLTTVSVKSNVGGQVVFLGVDEGDRVKAGQLIARIDPADSQTNLEQMQADLEGSRAKVSQAQESLAMQSQQQAAQLLSAQQAVEAARLRVSQAEKQAKLQVSDSAAAIEQAQQALESARARLAQAEEEAKIQPQLTQTAIDQAQSNLVAAKASYQQMKSASVPQMIASAQASFDQAKANYDYAVKNLERQKQLQAKGFVARSQVDSAQQSYQVASAQLDTARNKLDTVKDEAQQDLESAQAKVAQAEAALKSAEANKSQDSVKQHDVTAARAAVKQAEAALTSAQANKEQNSVKQDDVAAARATLKQAQASLDSIRADAYQVQIKQKDITQALAQVKHSEASVASARTQLGYTTITAPRNGIVIKKYVEPGSIVTAGRSSFSGSGEGVSLIDLADVSRMFVLVNVDETDIGQIAVGQDVDVTIDAYPNDLFVGKVTKISPQTEVEQNVTTIPVTVEITSPDLRLKPGMNATCDFITAKKKNVLRVPIAAITEGEQSSTVTVLQGGQQIVRQVEVGISDDVNTEIVSGLQEGDTVVTSIVQPGKGSSGSGTSSSGSSNRNRMRGGPPPM